MRRLWLAIGFLLAAMNLAYGQTAVLPIYACTLPGTRANVSGIKSTNYQQGVIPSCTVTVYLTGTETIATTSPQSPFTANTDGSIPPIFAAVNQGYDVVLSGGIAPNTYPVPVTLTGLYPGFSFNGSGPAGYPQCLGNSGVNTAYTCTIPDLTPVIGTVILFVPDVTSGTDATLAVNGGTAYPIFPATSPGSLIFGYAFILRLNTVFLTTGWEIVGTVASGLYGTLTPGQIPVATALNKLGNSGVNQPHGTGGLAGNPGTGQTWEIAPNGQIQLGTSGGGTIDDGVTFPDILTMQKNGGGALVFSDTFAGIGVSGGRGLLEFGFGNGTLFWGNIFGIVADSLNVIGKTGNPGVIQLFDSGSTNAITIQAPASITPYTIIPPSAQGTGALTNDGSGNLGWTPWQTSSLTDWTNSGASLNYVATCTAVASSVCTQWSAEPGGAGLSGMTAGQVPIAASASTITSSKALAGSGAGITTGPTSSTDGDAVVYTGTAGQTADAGYAPAAALAFCSDEATTFTPANGLCYFVTASVSTATPAASAFVLFNATTTSSGTLALTGITIADGGGCSGYIVSTTLTLTSSHSVTVKSDGTSIMATCI